MWDLGGVVAHFTPERRLHALASVTGIRSEVIHERIWQSGLEADAEAGRLGVEDTWRRLLSALEHRLTPDQLRHAWSLAFEPNATILQLVDRLEQPSVLLTNNGPVLAACLRAELAPIGSRFVRHLLSCDLRATKPAVEVFERAAARLRTAAHHLLLVDDDPANIAAASGLGWRTLHFRSDTTTDQLVSQLT